MHFFSLVPRQHVAVAPLSPGGELAGAVGCACAGGVAVVGAVKVGLGRKMIVKKIFVGILW